MAEKLAPLTCELSLPAKLQRGGGRIVGLGAGERAKQSRGVSLSAPRDLGVPLRGGRGRIPTPVVSREARGERRWLIPTPRLTLWERGGGRRRAPNNKERSGEHSPSSGRLGVAAARPSRFPPLGSCHLLPSRPPG